ncbi:MAG: 50S ribosomal protein L19 [Candidatus Fraserbacteria bacterium RBG_16_55_9]|uniref:50S ribosomal protein L19 n=1 Tax=Fraserbacteria sp. (strain RBG_16_55_9) TaxID=1817864 RepID=A0A1F5UP14_FRAXR|nr:MAG: 50S ribosomal protein L19 [Candidatus Fraserbacteria bacterium RBG_16_55_9]
MSSTQRDKFPAFRPGDLIRVHERITETTGEESKERIQVFEGIVLQIRGRGASRMLTVRKESFGIGVEKIFPLHSPKVAQIELVEKRRARRARLFYLRRQNTP